MKINSKAFAIPYSDYFIVNYKLDAVKIRIANALGFISILSIATLELYLKPFPIPFDP